MSTKLDRPLPKSLHTVSVLRNTAAYFIAKDGMHPKAAMSLALDILRLRKMPDVYHLVAAAHKQLDQKD